MSDKDEFKSWNFENNFPPKKTKTNESRINNGRTTKTTKTTTNKYNKWGKQTDNDGYDTTDNDGFNINWDFNENVPPMKTKKVTTINKNRTSNGGRTTTTQNRQNGFKKTNISRTN